ncbi:MAG: aminotransferase class V-fold PLP-dependent enzyme [Candidatus Aminicenantes bacterium]|nr:aminotransferase class V-fold PLP-dependent enzyme [Candidatus Aminicenantes bacterium]
MGSQDMYHFSDNSTDMSRRSILKGMAKGTAAGVLLPFLDFGQTESSFDLLKRTAAALDQKKAIGDERFWTLVKDQFLIKKNLVMLNAANLCPSPAVVQSRVIELTKNVDSDPSSANRAKFSALKEKSRQALANYVGADENEIAITRNTSEGNNFVINGVTLGKNDEVIIWDQNHPTANIAFDVRAERYGYKVIRVNTPDNPEGPDDLIKPFVDAMTPRTKLLAFSQVSNVSGIRIPAKELCSIARKNSILTLVDGAQTFGTLPLDLHDMGCDFFTASSHKWFCGPKEVGILYVQRDRIESLYPSHVGVGWESAIKGGARKFDNLGQQDDSRVSAMFEAAQFHDTIGKLRISTRAQMLSDAIKNGLKKRIPHVKFVTPIDHNMSWGVVIFEVPGLDSSKAVEVLYGQHNIGCAAMGPNIRFSPHFYNPLSEIERAVDAIIRLT